MTTLERPPTITATPAVPQSEIAPLTVTAPRTSPASLLEQMGEPLDPSSYDWGLVTRSSLSSEEVFQLGYAAQVEWATEGTFASLDISTDPTVGAFLRVWLAQEVVHGDLLARVLDLAGSPVSPAHTTGAQRRAARRGRLVNVAAHRVVGDDFLALHMLWGAVNELTTLRFYRLIRRSTDNDVLRAILHDVIAQEALHYSFYLCSASERLEGNVRGQRIVRWAMSHLWSPVGVGLRTQQDARRLFALLENEPSQVAQIDAAINRVPGMSGLDLISRTLARSALS